MVAGHSVMHGLPQPFDLIDPGMVDGLEAQLELAVVRQPTGHATGLVDDVVVEDEHDAADSVERFVRLEGDRVDVDARLPIHEFNREIGLEFGGELSPQIPLGEGFETVGGFLSSSMGRIPEPGDTHVDEGFHFEVLEADGRAIRRVRIRLQPAGAPGESS